MELKLSSLNGTAMKVSSSVWDYHVIPKSALDGAKGTASEKMHVNVQFINSNSVVICKVRRTKVNEPFMEYKAQSFWYDNFEGPVFLVGPDF